MPIKEIRTKLNLAEGSLSYFVAISRGKNSVETVLSLAGLLWLRGNEVEFSKVNLLEPDLV